MAVYAIGDLQGCFDSLNELLDKLAFGSADTLWFTGDLVNRGPQSLECLRYVKSLGERAITVLGNHDLHLLALASGRFANKPNRTLQPILHADDCNELLHWLRHRPIFFKDDDLGWSMAHAGIHPRWDLETVESLAREVEAELRGDSYLEFMQHMYGNHPDNWHANLTGHDRIRFAVNVFTRMRYCFDDGRIDFLHKGPLGTQGGDLKPWFDISRSANFDYKLVFGHWSALGFFNKNGVTGVDTGCLWGGSLTALRLDASESEPISIKCPRHEKVHG